MLRIVEEAARTDTGRQRHANEDAYFARSPIYVVADGMGGAQAGEVASRIAADAFDSELTGDNPEQALAERANEANRRIFDLARADESRSGMGTTLTGVMLDGGELSIVHVGDSRAYLYRDAQLRQLTRDHSLVEELRRQGRLTSEEAEEHPQRSIITRALGPEQEVELDVHSHQVRAGDVVLLCSDGLTSMVREERLAEILSKAGSLEDAVNEMISEANRAGGRDNITVICLRIGGDRESNDGPADDVGETMTGMHARDLEAAAAASAEAEQRTPRPPAAARREPATRSRRRWPRRVAVTFVVALALGGAGIGASIGLKKVYFIGRDGHGLVALYRGLPYELPGDIKLYSEQYASSVPAGGLSRVERDRLLDHQLRSRKDAADLIRRLERGDAQR